VSKNSTAATGSGSADKTQSTLQGTVVSAKTAKTIAVEIQRVEKHARYGKYIRRTSRLLAHDEAGEAREGDTVTIAQSRPISRRKSWRLVAVVGRASAV
jgi:small subunit ribosomal protein S17